MNDIIKSDDESRISMKYATLPCLSYLSTISYIWLSLLKVLHLLSVRKHGDPYLRGACANLLAKLIQTTVLHLLSVREHGDPHLRGACAKLLAKLIQTTIHFLTLLSLSN
ncbi:unnamed protein product [Rotaria sp. Silwood2]|nr:unnamed protein product [Rotaria sp. Silwood2]